MRIQEAWAGHGFISAAGKNRVGETDDLAREALRGGSARDEFPPRNRYARPCERMRGGAGRFSREKDKVTAGAGDKGRHDGYVRTVERLGRPWEAGL